MASRPSSTPLHWLARAAAKIYFVAHAALALLLSFVTKGEGWKAAKELWKEGGDSSVDAPTWIKLAHRIWSASPTPGQGTAAPSSTPGSDPSRLSSKDSKIEPPSYGQSGIYAIWPWGRGDQKLSYSLNSMQEAEELCSYAEKLESCGLSRQEIGQIHDKDELKKFGANEVFVKLFLDHHLLWSDLKRSSIFSPDSKKALELTTDQVRLLLQKKVSFDTVEKLLKFPFGIVYLPQLQKDRFDDALLASPETLQLLIDTNPLGKYEDNYEEIKNELKKRLEDRSVPLPQDGREINRIGIGYEGYEIWPWGTAEGKKLLRSSGSGSLKRADQLCTYARELEAIGVPRNTICDLTESQLESFSRHAKKLDALMKLGLPFEDKSSADARLSSLIRLSEEQLRLLGETCLTEVQALVGGLGREGFFRLARLSQDGLVWGAKNLARLQALKGEPGRFSNADLYGLSPPQFECLESRAAEVRKMLGETTLSWVRYTLLSSDPSVQEAMAAKKGITPDGLKILDWVIWG